MKPNRIIGGFLWLAAIVVAVYVVPRWFGAGVAPRPPAFAQGLTLTAARSEAKSNKKPVLVFATANWCGACQEMKRTTLVEPKVAKTIRDDFNSVYLDVDQSRGEGADLKVFSLPTTIVMVGDQELARIEGAMDAPSYLSWLEAAWAQAKTGVVPPRSRDLQPGETPREDASGSSTQPTPPAK